MFKYLLFSPFVGISGNEVRFMELKADSKMEGKSRGKWCLDSIPQIQFADREREKDRKRERERERWDAKLPSEKIYFWFSA